MHVRRGFNTLVETRYGLMLCNRNDVYVSGGLIHYGEYSELEVAYVRQLLPVGGVVLQAGAHFGTITIPLAQHIGPDGMLHAFEPQRLAFQTLTANVALASLENTVTHQAAVGNASGVAVIPSNDPWLLYNTGGVRLNEREDGERVAVVALDDLFTGLPRFDLLHADVEGMEEDVVRGAERLLTAHRPVLYVEAIDFDKRASLFGYMRSLGYRLWLHEPPMYNPDNYGANRVNLLNAQNRLAPGGIRSFNVLGWPHTTEPPQDPYLKPVPE